MRFGGVWKRWWLKVSFVVLLVPNKRVFRIPVNYVNYPGEMYSGWRPTFFHTHKYTPTHLKLHASKMAAQLHPQWRKITESETLRRSSQIVAAIDGTAYVFGGELRPREPRDNDLHLIKFLEGSKPPYLTVLIESLFTHLTSIQNPSSVLSQPYPPYHQTQRLLHE